MTDLEKRLEKACSTGDVDPSDVADVLGFVAAERKRRETVEDELHQERLAHAAAVTRAEQAERDKVRASFDRLRSAIDAESSGAERIHAALVAAGIPEEDEVSGVIGLEEHVARALERIRALEDALSEISTTCEAKELRTVSVGAYAVEQQRRVIERVWDIARSVLKEKP